MGTNTAFRFYRGEKILLNPPVGFQFWGKFDNVQPAISHFSCLYHVGIKVVSERTAAAVYFHPITRRERIDPAKLKNTLGAVIQCAKDGEHVGNDDFVALADWLNDFATREDTIDFAKPSL